jgi:hypothetical protein
MNNANNNIFRAIIFTVVSIVITIVSWLVISLSGTQNSWFYFFPVFGAIISLIFSVIVIFQEKDFFQEPHDQPQDELTITKMPIKITFEIDDTPASLEAPDVESAAKLLEVLRTKHSESTTHNISDFPEFP